MAPRDFRASENGGVALMFALIVPALITFLGAILDYRSAANVHARLTRAADASALAGVAKNLLTSSATTARAQAVQAFNADFTPNGATKLGSVDIAVTDDGLARTAKVKATATVKTVFGRFIGLGEIAVAAQSTASSSLPSYLDFYLLLDNTPSMGIGATAADVATMVANTSDQCGFACHITGSKNDYYSKAKKLGVTMRIDVLRQATQQLMDTAKTSAVISNQFRMAIYTLGEACDSTSISTITPLTAHLSSAKHDAAAIDLMTIPYQGYNNDQCTDHARAFNAMNGIIPAAGDGSTSATAQKILLFVGDGVTDAYYPSTCTRPTTGGRCQEPLNPAFCTALKNRGVKIAVLYTTYLPLPTNAWYNTWIGPFQPSIGTKMQACASPGLYFEVSPTEGIGTAMTKLFEKAVAMARLTQ